MGLLDNAITVEEFQKRKKESLAKSRFKETGSVMSRPISEEWQPDNVRHGGHALEAPMFSPDDLIGSGIFSKLGLLATYAAPALASGLLGVVAKNKGVSTMPSKIARALDKQAGAIAWHGSPHKFDKFYMSKIGTGEGAQAYGHGLYMAEAPEVAKSYAETLSGKANNPLSDVANYWRGNGGESAYRKFAKDAGIKQTEIDEMAKAISGVNGGVLYKVDIPDEAVARFLDWDKPLNQQAPEVQKIFPPDVYGSGGKSLGSAMKELEFNHGISPSQISDQFKKQGIPGIRYLDGGSRGTGSGTSNYVLFDDQLPRILEINGQPTGLQPWAKGEWKGLLSQ